MKTRDINKLIEKYWNAETSLEEEKTLRSYFNGSDIDPEHLEFTPLFRALKMESVISASHIQLTPPKEVVRPKRIISIFRKWNAVAAVFIAILAVVFVMKNEGLTTKQSATVVNVESPEEALEYTKAALAMLSKNYRKGTSELSSSMNNVNRMNIIK